TNSPSPAPTVSTVTKVRPVPTSERRSLVSRRYGSTTSSLWPTIDSVFCVATTAPVTFARNIRLSFAFAVFAFEQRFDLPCDNKFFIGGHNPQLHLAAIGVNGCFALGDGVVSRIERDA